MSDRREPGADWIADVAATAAAPAGLRARVEDSRGAAVKRRRRATGAAAAVTAVLVSALAALLAGPLGTQTTVADAAVAALRAPQAPAVADPYPGATGGWRATSAGRARVDGHRAVTAGYARGRLRARYLVVSGSRLAIPDGARRLQVGNRRYVLLRRGDVNIVAWRRPGADCVVVSRDASTAGLLELAAGR